MRILLAGLLAGGTDEIEIKKSDSELKSVLKINGVGMFYFCMF